MDQAHPRIIPGSPESMAWGELIGWDSTHSNMNISETSWQIVIKFHPEIH